MSSKKQRENQETHTHTRTHKKKRKKTRCQKCHKKETENSISISANKKQREENARKSEVYQEVLFDLRHKLLIVIKIFSISDQEPGKIEENEEKAVANGCKERRFENAGLICFPLQSLSSICFIFFPFRSQFAVAIGRSRAESGLYSYLRCQ